MIIKIERVQKLKMFKIINIDYIFLKGPRIYNKLYNNQSVIEVSHDETICDLFAAKSPRRE